VPQILHGFLDVLKLDGRRKKGEGSDVARMEVLLGLPKEE
jgi:hypothetical protein